MPKTCADCFYSAPNNETSIVCRRYPPTITKVVELNLTCFFPILSPTAWCGEWIKGAKTRPTQQ